MLAFGFVAVTILAVSVVAQAGSEQDGVPVVYGYKICQRCPAQNFYDDCNSCTCSAGGYDASCTKAGGCSEPKPGTVPQKPLYAPCYKSGDKCPAKYFFDGCSNCTCQDDGVALCTMEYCITKEKRKCKMCQSIMNYNPSAIKWWLK